jgi:uncharacterized membrane protein
MRELLSSGYARIAGLFCPLLAIMFYLEVEPYTIETVFLILACCFLFLGGRDRRALLPAAVAIFFYTSLLADILTGALYYPVLMSLLFFLLFFQSLWSKECFVQRIARKLEPNIPQHALSYCYKVHIVWTVFLGINTVVAFYSMRDIKFWSLYNGVLSYVFMAALFAIEYGFRCYYRKRMEQA